LWGAGTVLLYYDYLTGSPVRFFTVCLAYIGLILTPIAVLFLSLVFAKTRIKFNWKYVALFIVPLISIIMLLTNNEHHLFYRYLRYEDLADAASLGSYFIVHTLYSYICLLVGMVNLIRFSIKNAGFFSWQSLFIFLGILSSFGYNALLTFQVIKGQFHTNVVVFIVTFAFFYLAIVKFDLFRVVPIALQNVVDHISDSYLVIDTQEMVIDFNKTFQDTFSPLIKVSRKETLDCLIERTEDNPAFQDVLKLVKEDLNQNDSRRYEQSFEIAGQEKFFVIEVTPLINNGVYLSTVILFKDMTEIHAAMETIQRNHEILTEQERLASLGQLIGGIAHNLKTPIMSIAGCLEGLLDLIAEYEHSVGDPIVTVEDHHEIAQEMKSWIEKIRPYCAYMSDIISTVKGQASQFSSDNLQTTFMLDELIKRVELLMRHELKKYHCVLRIQNQIDLSLKVQGDVSSLVQIFDNLIMNAIHAYQGKSGTIDLTIQRKDDQVLFTLTDLGVGIPTAIQERLFKEMVTTKGKAGTGLGLYMSYATIRGRFNGDMWFESQEGNGTTFYISIPIFRAADSSVEG
jgi:two-component system sensor histidine kinase HupT/HoxJ